MCTYIFIGSLATDNENNSLDKNGIVGEREIIESEEQEENETDIENNENEGKKCEQEATRFEKQRT